MFFKRKNNDRDERATQIRWAAVRRVVVARDGHKCTVCGSKHKLEVHHLNNWKHYPDDRYDASNCTTLCRKCHRSFHAWMGGSWVATTAENFYSWRRGSKSKAILTYLIQLRRVIIILTITGAFVWTMLNSK